MNIRLLSDRVGNRFVQRAGQVVDLPRSEAMSLIAAKSAESVEPVSGGLETASVGAPENAARRPGRPRKAQEVR